MGAPHSPRGWLECHDWSAATIPLLFGTEEGRALGRQVVARTEVAFSVATDMQLERCLLALREFSTVLRLRKPQDVFYGWGRVFVDRELKRVSFKVLWYDRGYFARRKGAYRSNLHERALATFGITPADLCVTHHEAL